MGVGVGKRPVQRDAGARTMGAAGGTEEVPREDLNSKALPKPAKSLTSSARGRLRAH